MCVCLCSLRPDSGDTQFSHSFTLSLTLSLSLTHSHYTRAIERVSALRGEIESYKRELANLEEEQATKAPELTAVRKQLTSLRMEVAGVKQEGESIEARFNEERTRRRTKFAREEERLMAELASADEALSRQEVHVANRKEDACAMYAVRVFVLSLARPLPPSLLRSRLSLPQSSPLTSHLLLSSLLFSRRAISLASATRWPLCLTERTPRLETCASSSPRCSNALVNCRRSSTRADSSSPWKAHTQ